MMVFILKKRYYSVFLVTLFYFLGAEKKKHANHHGVILTTVFSITYKSGNGLGHYYSVSLSFVGQTHRVICYVKVTHEVIKNLISPQILDKVGHNTK